MGAEQIVSRVAARQHGVISRGQALDAGLTRSAIGTRILRGQWVRIDTAVYVVAAAPHTWRRQLWAAYLSRPEALVAGRSAARLLSFPGVGPSRPEILLPFRGNARSPLARIIRSRHYELIGHQPVDGFEVTTRAETVFTLGFTNPPASIERWVDWLMAAHRLKASDFDLIFARLTNARVRGLPALKRIVLARDHDAYQPPTSELERLLYRMLDRDELPPYSRQVPFAFDQVDATVDAYVDSWRMIVEGDGRRWHTRKADFERDRLRDNAAAAEGIVVIRFTYRMLKSDLEACVRTLLEAGQWR